MRAKAHITREVLENYCDAGYSFRRIASMLKVSFTTVKNYVKKFKIKKVNSKAGRKRIISKRVGDRMKAKYKKCELLSARDGISFINEVSNIQPSKQTVIRELKNRRFKCRVRPKKPDMSDGQMKKREKFYQVHKNFNYQDFQKYIFSDESSFQVKSPSKQRTFYCLDNEHPSPKSYRPTLKFGGGSVMVWGYISFKGVGKIVRIEGTITKQKYCDLLESALLDGMTDQSLSIADYTFVQDNAPSHTADLTKKWLREQHISVLEWPPNSPDMNIIEHVWAELDKAVRLRDQEIFDKDSLFNVIEDEWKKIPLSYIQRLYKSLPRRIAALKACSFKATKY